MINRNFLVCGLLSGGLIGPLLISGITQAQNGFEPESEDTLQNLFNGDSLTINDLMRAADVLEQHQNQPKDLGGEVDSAVEAFREKQQRRLQIGPEILDESETDQEDTTAVELVDP